MRTHFILASLLISAPVFAVDLQPNEIITMEGTSVLESPQLAGAVVWGRDYDVEINNGFGFVLYKATLEVDVVHTPANNSYMFECRVSNPDGVHPGEVVEIRWRGFEGFHTDCDWREDFGLGDAVALRVGRSGDGDLITFGYNWWDMDPGGEKETLQQGEESNVMFIHTDAPSYLENAGLITVELKSGDIWSAIAPAPGLISTDINSDGQVDGADLGILISDWGTTGPEADLNLDGIVDGGDLGVLLASWK